jgi:ribosomal protein L37E
LKNFVQVFLETDMRAMNNPTRMSVIETATKKLIEKILHQCPKCGFPGFDVTKVVAGLPCKLCGFPTNRTWYYIYKCTKCHFKGKKFYLHGIEQEEPTFCDHCNP